VRRATCHLKQITKFCLTLRQVAFLVLASDIAFAVAVGGVLVAAAAFPGAAPVMPWQNYGQTQSDVVVVVNDVVRLCLGRCRKSSAV